MFCPFPALCITVRLGGRLQRYVLGRGCEDQSWASAGLVQLHGPCHVCHSICISVVGHGLTNLKSTVAGQRTTKSWGTFKKRKKLAVRSSLAERVCLFSPLPLLISYILHIRTGDDSKGYFNHRRDLRARRNRLRLPRLRLHIHPLPNRHNDYLRLNRGHLLFRPQCSFTSNQRPPERC